MIDACYLKTGLLVKVVWGNKGGVQLAIVTRGLRGAYPRETIKARKWLTNSRRWTSPVTVYRTQITVGVAPAAPKSIRP